MLGRGERERWEKGGKDKQFLVGFFVSDNDVKSFFGRKFNSLMGRREEEG